MIINYDLLKDQFRKVKNAYSLIPSQKDIFSFSLFGTDKYYFKCGMRLLKQVLKRHTDVYIIIHCDSRNYNLVKAESIFKHPNTLFIDLGTEPFPFCGHLWRMLPLEHNFNSITIRDLDTEWTKRDAEIYTNWLFSDFNAHIIRDDYGQNKEILGGSWGVKKKKIFVKEAYIKYISKKLKSKKLNTDLHNDLTFLAVCVYPLIKEFAAVYTSCNIYITDKNVFKLRDPISDDSESGEILSHGQHPKDFLKFMTDDDHNEYYPASQYETRLYLASKDIRSKNHIYSVLIPRIKSGNFFINHFALIGYLLSGLITLRQFISRILIYFNSINIRSKARISNHQN